jgi:hypothetical protein
MQTVHRVLEVEHPNRDWLGVIIGRWLLRNQPCTFGRTLADWGAIHYCIVLESDIESAGPEYIEKRVLRDLRRWLRRGRRLRANGPMPASGFLLCVLGPRIANAAPDPNLLAFANSVKRLVPRAVVKDGAARLDRVPLFLEHPDTGALHRFAVNLDYFGAQGDGRWWGDHRFPGGIAFTMNSVGHLVNLRTWYEMRPRYDVEIALSQARRTIKSSKGHSDSGPNTKFDHEADPQEFSYLAMYDTDENTRPIFFCPPDVRTAGEYPHCMGLQYITDAGDRDHASLIAGERTTEEEFERAMLRFTPAWEKSAARDRYAGASLARAPRRPIPPEVRRALRDTAGWQLTEEERRAFFEPQ